MLAKSDSNVHRAALTIKDLLRRSSGYHLRRVRTPLRLKILYHRCPVYLDYANSELSSSDE
jgi:hypothetical protein